MISSSYIQKNTDDESINGRHNYINIRRTIVIDLTYFVYTIQLILNLKNLNVFVVKDVVLNIQGYLYLKVNGEL